MTKTYLVDNLLLTLPQEQI